MKRIMIIALLLAYGCVYSQTGHISGNAILNGTAKSQNFSHINISFQKVGTGFWNTTGINASDLQNINFSSLGSWDTSFVRDRDYIIKLNVTDNFSQSSVDYVYVTVDNLHVITPQNKSVHVQTAPLYINGTATGTNYLNYSLYYYYEPTPNVTSTDYITLIDNGYPNKSNSTLAIVNTTLFNVGAYLFNFSMQNVLGFTTNEIYHITIIAPDGYEPDDNYSTANYILVNSSQEHNFMPEDDIDIIMFNVTENKKYIVSTYADDPYDSLSDTVIGYYKSTPFDVLSDTPDDYDDDSGPGFLSTLEFLATENSTYYAYIAHWAGYKGGIYNVSVNEYGQYHKGAIPTSYSVPFYTYDQNPKTCYDVKNGEYCNMSWEVRVRASEGTYDFFTIIDTVYNTTTTPVTKVALQNYAPPTITIGHPANGTKVEASNTVLINLTTDYAAFCRYSTSEYLNSYYEGWSFWSTGGTEHHMNVSVPTYINYNYYYICRRYESGAYSDSERIHHRFKTKAPVDEEDDEEEEEEEDDESTAAGTTTGAPVLSSSNPVAKVLRAYVNLEMGDTIELEVESSKLAIDTIKVPIKKNITGVTRLGVQNVPEAPDNEPSEKVYQYVQIDTMNLDHRSMGTVEMDFTVDKSWLDDEEIDAEDVVLYRHDEIEDIWEQLQTVLVDENSDDYEYTATFTGFSMFAIGAREEIANITANVTVNKTINMTANQSNETVELKPIPAPVTAQVIQEQPAEPKRFPWDIIIIAIVLALLGSASTIAYAKKEVLMKKISGLKKSKPKTGKEPEKHEVKQQTLESVSTIMPTEPKKNDINVVMETVIDMAISIGYNESTIKSQLASQYTEAELSNAFSAIRKLHKYTSDHVMRGFDANSIQTVLIGQGWHLTMIEKLFRLMKLKNPSSSGIQ